MKALLLAFSFLLLFSIVVFSSRNACRDFTYDSFLYIKRQQLPALFYSSSQLALFKKAHPTKKEQQESQLFANEEPKKADFRARVKFSRETEMSKINLGFLIDKELYPHAKEHIAKMLLEVYGKKETRPALIATMEDAEMLLEELGECMKKATPNDRFRDFKLERKKTLFYQLLQGTQKFDLEKGIGVVPFEDLFIFYPANPKTLLFCSRASMTSIALLFSKEFAKKIGDIEKEASAHLRIGEWKSLIQALPDNDFAMEAVDFVNNSSKGPAQIKSVNVDSDTGLKMEGRPSGKTQEELEEI